MAVSISIRKGSRDPKKTNATQRAEGGVEGNQTPQSKKAAPEARRKSSALDATGRQRYLLREKAYRDIGEPR